jgi:hypothetical protein
MERKVFGHRAPAPRMTKSAAALVALACALPVGGVLWLIEALWL